MTSKFPDENGETEEETLHKKRARRVSFAETTAVHFFNRDEESETTPDAVKEDQSSTNAKLRRSESDEIMELLRSSSDEDSDGGGDDVDILLKNSFLRPMESPSSGSCFGSATSNDEDNFFGPVSAEFIIPGRLSDSAISDENHEVTMDSTAFSMNFRSLARSDSGGEFKTPTGVRVPFGEKTPSQTSIAASIGDLMVLTGATKRVTHSSLPANKVNDSGNSDDMSLVGENHRRYDYGELPPELDDILAESNEDVEAVSLTGDIECSNSMSAPNTKNDHELSKREIFDLTDNRHAFSCHITDLSKTSGEAISVDLMNAEKGNDDISDATVGEITRNQSNHVDNVPGHITPSHDHIQATFLQIHDIPLEKDREGRIGSEVSGTFDSPPSITQSKFSHELPIAGSITSLLTKRRHIFKDSDGLPNAQLNSPQGDKEFRVEGTINRAWSTSVFAKSVSRLKRLETSFLSASKVEGNASRLRVSGVSPRSMEKDDNVDYVSRDISLTRVDAPVACLDVRFAEFDGQFQRAGERDSYASKTTGIVEHASCVEVKKDEGLSGLHKSSPSPKTSAQRLIVSSSAASLETGLANCMSKDSHESELETHAIKSQQSMQSNSSLVEITFNDLKDSNNSGMRGDFACLSGSGVVDKVSASPLYEGCPFTFNPDHHGQKEADDLASTVENYSSLLVEKKDKSKLFSSDMDHAEDVLQQKRVHKNQSINPAKPALKDEISKSRNVISSNDDVETGRSLTSSFRGLPVQRMQSIPGSTLISDARSNEPPVQVFENPKEEPVCSMLLKETLDLRADAKVNFSKGHDDATLDKLMSKYTEDAQLLQKSSDICARDSPSSHKRKLFDETNDHNVHALLLQRKPKLRKEKKYEEEHKMSHCIESDSALRDWVTVFTSFCGVTEQLLTPMSDKFNVALIAKLDDILVHLDKLKSYELLHHEKSLDPAHLFHSKRVANTKLLLYRTVYLKAKLQLLCLKRDKLSDQACRMKSRVDKSEKIMSCCHHITRHGEIDQIGCLPLEHYCTDTDNRSLVSAKISSLRKEFEDSDGEIRKIDKSFYPYIKDMKELTSTGTAASVKGLLKKMVECQSLQSEFQLCKVEKLHAMHGQPNIIFDHGGFMLQSFITKSTATSGLLLANSLSNEKISKMFINGMDSNTAFSFVFSGDTQITYEGLRTIAEQTQKTVSLLHILLDVIDEVQLATIELKSLTWSRFCQPSAGKLDLQLCFTDFRSGARVTLSIDITCLNRGVYPSQVLPYEVRGITARQHDIFESLVADIQTAVRGVRCGVMRILSICRCVSRMVQTGGMSKAVDTH